MVMDIRQVPYAQARDVFNRLGQEVCSNGTVPRFSQLVRVYESEALLTADDRIMIASGLEDKQLITTVNLMPLSVRFALREGYSFNWHNGEAEEYIKGQIPLYNRIVGNLREYLGREPTHQEKADKYILNRGLDYFLYNLIKRADRAYRRVDRIDIPSNRDAMNRRMASSFRSEFEPVYVQLVEPPIASKEVAPLIPFPAAA